MEILTALCIQKIKVRLLFAVFFNVESQKTAETDVFWFFRTQWKNKAVCLYR